MQSLEPNQTLCQSGGPGSLANPPFVHIRSLSAKTMGMEARPNSICSLLLAGLVRRMNNGKQGSKEERESFWVKSLYPRYLPAR